MFRGGGGSAILAIIQRERAIGPGFRRVMWHSVTIEDAAQGSEPRVSSATFHAERLDNTKWEVCVNQWVDGNHQRRCGHSAYRIEV